MSFAAVLERLQKLENPYPGLRPFETHEPHLFFGRDQQVAELVARLERNRFLAVLGVSGSGKSSLVRAGLVPALQRSNVGEAGAHWRMVITRPAGTPFQSLAGALSESGLDSTDLRQSSHGLVQVARQLPRDETLLVVVDQFEELFRYKDREPVTEEARRAREAAAAEASEFAQLLLVASSQQPPVYIVVTMRSDYLGDCAEFRDLPETLNNCQYLIPRLTREQRKQAIEGPLGRTAIAPNLVQRILNDAGDEPDQLPILQHALMRTWSHWRRSDPDQKRRIELQDYEAIGGFENALNQHADELLEGVSAEIAATIFKRLTARGRGDRERRDPATLAELWAVCAAETPQQQSQVNAVIDHFRHGEATFLTPREGALLPETYIDISHESLIRLWKKLRDEWLPQESKSAKTFLYLLDRATRKGEKLLGLDLTEAVEWNRQRNQTAAWARHYADDGDLKTVLEFIAASQIQERKRRLQKRMFSVTLPLTLMFALLAGFAGYEWNKVRSLGVVSLSRQLVNQSALLQGQNALEAATLLAIEGMERHPGFEADNAMRSTQESLKLLPIGVVPLIHKGPVNAVIFSPDGRYLATGSDDKTARVFDAASGKEVARFIHQDAVRAVAFGRNGRYVATGCDDKTARVFEVGSGQEISRLKHEGAVLTVAFSPDGRYVATGSEDSLARVFEAYSGNEISRFRHEGAVFTVAFSPDGRYVATASEDKTARVFEATTSKQIWRLNHQGTVYDVAFSADGRYIATASDDYTARVWDTHNGKEVTRLIHQGTVYSVAFSRDGHYVATGSQDNTARVFETASGKEVARLNHQGTVYGVAFSANGHYIATGSQDKTARVFESTSGKEVARLYHQGPVNPVAFSATGRQVATGSQDGIARVFEAASVKEVHHLTIDGTIGAVALSPDGRYVATGGSDTMDFHSGIFEAASGAKLHSLIPQGPFDAVAFSADGRYVVTSGTSMESDAIVYEAASGTEVARLAQQGRVYAVAFSADGRYVATGSQDKTARVFEVASRKEIVHLVHQGPVRAVALSADGRYIATGSENNTAQVFEVASGRQVALFTHQAPIRSVAFSPDGHYIASGSDDKTARVFEVTENKEIARMTHQGPVRFVAFSPDGRYVATGSEDKTARVFEAASGMDVSRMVLTGRVKAIRYTEDGRHLLIASTGASEKELIFTQHRLRPEDLIADACSRLTRNLTPDEWRQYVGPEVPYHRTCPKLP